MRSLLTPGGRRRRVAWPLLTTTLALSGLLGASAAGAQPATTTSSAVTTTSTTIAPTTTTAPPTTTTTAPTTTTSTVPRSTTTGPRPTTTTTEPATTTTTPVTHPSSSVAAWVWVVVALVLVALIGIVVALLARRRRQDRFATWVARAGAAINDTDGLALHLASAEAAALPTLAGRDAPQLAALSALLRDLRANAPEGSHGEDLARLMAAAGRLQTLLMSAQIPGGTPVAPEIHQAAAEVTSAAATARAGLARLQGPGR